MGDDGRKGRGDGSVANLARYLYSAKAFSGRGYVSDLSDVTCEERCR